MRSFLRDKRFIALLAVVVLLVAGGTWYYYAQVIPAQASSTAGTIQTARVRRGNLAIVASGTGTLIPSTDVSLGFRVGGILAEVPVEVGDRVEVGDVLAQLDTAALERAVTQAEIAMRQAQISLATLTEEASAADLAAAQSSLASAKAVLTQLTTPASSEDVLAARQNLKSAQDQLKDLLAGPDQNTIASAKADLTLAEIDLKSAQADYDQIAWKSDAAGTSQAIALWQATTSYEKAKATYGAAVQGASADEIATARAQVASAQSTLDSLLAAPDADEVAAAQAQVDQSQAELDSLLAGPDERTIESLQLDVQLAQLNLAAAQENLADATLTAPFAGVVAAVHARPGETASTAPIITLADMAQPLVELYMDEADLDKIALGKEVTVVFDALPAETFTGRVVQMEPQLVLIDGVPTIQARAILDEESLGHPRSMLAGLNASVEVAGNRANNVLLVPVEALRELAPGNYAVFVIADGQPQTRAVEVGLMDFSYAEIVSGLEEGEVVSTGMVETE